MPWVTRLERQDGAVVTGVLPTHRPEGPARSDLELAPGATPFPMPFCARIVRCGVWTAQVPAHHVREPALPLLYLRDRRPCPLTP
jgi:hypothetical protein